MLIEQRHESLNPGKKKYVGTSPAEAPKVTNKKFSENKLFQKACTLAGVEPTARQASKFRNGKGLAFLHRNLQGGAA